MLSAVAARKARLQALLPQNTTSPASGTKPRRSPSPESVSDVEHASAKPPSKRKNATPAKDARKKRKVIEDDSADYEAEIREASESFAALQAG